VELYLERHIIRFYCHFPDYLIRKIWPFKLSVSFSFSSPCFPLPFTPTTTMESHFTSFPTPTDRGVPPVSHPDPKAAKKPRNRHSPYQLAALNELYEQNDHPPLQDRIALAERISM